MTKAEEAVFNNIRDLLVPYLHKPLKNTRPLARKIAARLHHAKLIKPLKQ